MNYEEILELTNEQLDSEVAKALGWKIEINEFLIYEYYDVNGKYRGYACNYRPSENWNPCGHLVLQCKNFMLTKGCVEWVAVVDTNIGTGDTPALAICRAFVLSKQ